MSNMSVHFSSATDDWATPQDLFDRLNESFCFTLDVCASEKNAKCSRYFTREQDGLKQSWDGEICWMNPPYGREIKKWVQKAASISGGGRSGLFIAGKNRYGVVARLCNSLRRNRVFTWAVEVRRTQKQRAIPQRNRSVWK